MTSNQRRPGFRLPWASESEEANARPDQAAEPSDAARVAGATATTAAASPAATAPVAAAAEPPAAEVEVDPAPAAAGTKPPAPPPAPPVEPAGAPSATVESSAEFMRDLVAAMRRVAEETRQSGLSDLRTKAEEQVRTLEADAERRRSELSARAEKDVAAVGEWAATETERIKQEAEQRVVARRANLDQQLAAETTRAEAEAKTLRDRVADYEQELDAYHAQLSDIADPAAFAAAAKRMPAPPRLAGATGSSTDASPSTESPLAAPEVHPAEEEVLASRLAELDAALEPSDLPPAASEPAVAAVTSAPSTEPTATEILVKGLGSFGAITGFRQSLASVDGVEGVSLSLGPTGEFVFRAVHPAGFDVASAITKLEGDAATVEPQADGGLRVTLDRAR